tara:strand:+ start:165 stop:341 length:177 start_codon:yes stop_codon:yes gene_type:complete
MWMLFAIIIGTDQYMVYPQGPFNSMEQCFEAREYFMETAPKPKINYESVCIQVDKAGL